MYSSDCRGVNEMSPTIKKNDNERPPQRILIAVMEPIEYWIAITNRPFAHNEFLRQSSNNPQRSFNQPQGIDVEFQTPRVDWGTYVELDFSNQDMTGT
jgi:hypothetical protein